MKKNQPFEATPILTTEQVFINQQKERIAELENLLLSARAIAERQGSNTSWALFSARLAKAKIGKVTPRVFKVPQPFIIEAGHRDGDNQINFSIRGSVEWGEDHQLFTELNLEYILGTQVRDGVSEKVRLEVSQALEAMQKHQSYEGENVKVKFNQEGK